MKLGRTSGLTAVMAGVMILAGSVYWRQLRHALIRRIRVFTLCRRWLDPGRRGFLVGGDGSFFATLRHRVRVQVGAQSPPDTVQ